MQSQVLTFKVNDINLSTFSKIEKRQIKSFQKFVNQKPDGFCCVCLTLLYPEQQYFRDFPNDEHCYCIKWKIEPIFLEDTPSMKMVCKSHLKSNLANFKPFEYPG